MWRTDELAALGKVVMNFTALEACADRLLARVHRPIVGGRDPGGLGSRDVEAREA